MNAPGSCFTVRIPPEATGYLPLEKLAAKFQEPQANPYTSQRRRFSSDVTPRYYLKSFVHIFERGPLNSTIKSSVKQKKAPSPAPVYRPSKVG